MERPGAVHGHADRIREKGAGGRPAIARRGGVEATSDDSQQLARGIHLEDHAARCIGDINVARVVDRDALRTVQTNIRRDPTTALIVAADVAREGMDHTVRIDLANDVVERIHDVHVA